HAFRPRIDLRELAAEGEAIEISLALLRIVQNLAADLVEADALRPFVDALKIVGLLAVHLDERHDMFQRVIFRFDKSQNFRAPDIEARRAGEMDLITGVDADHADVLAGRLGAVARTTRDRHLDLGRRPRTPHEFLDADAKPGRILRAEAAPVRPDAGFDRAQTLGVG